MAQNEEGTEEGVSKIQGRRAGPLHEIRGEADESAKEKTGPTSASGDVALAAKEKRYTDVLHEPNSSTGQILKAMEALLDDPRLKDAGMSENMRLLPGSRC